MTSAGFKADPQTWAAAGHEVGDVSGVLAGVTSRLCRVLAECWGAWGPLDDIGAAFGHGADGKPGFEPAADNLLTALALNVNMLARTAWGLQVAGPLFVAADGNVAGTLGAHQLPGPWRVPPPVTYKLPTVSRRPVSSDPVPAWCEWLLDQLAKYVIDCQYPLGNMGALGTIISEFSAAGKTIAELAVRVHNAAAPGRSVNAGSAADQFGLLAESLISGLEWLASQCQALAASTDNLLRQKNAARIEFWGALAVLAALQAAAASLSFFTAGLSEAGFLAALVGKGVGLRAMLIYVLRMVVEGIVFSAGNDAVGQFARMHEDLQKNFSDGEFLTSAETGALASVVMFGLGSGLRAGAGVSSTTLEAVLGEDSARGRAARLAVNILAGTGGNLAAQAAFNDGHVDLAKATAFAVAMAGIGEPMDKVNRVAEALGQARAIRNAGTPAEPAAPAGHPGANPVHRGNGSDSPLPPTVRAATTPAGSDAAHGSANAELAGTLTHPGHDAADSASPPVHAAPQVTGAAHAGAPEVATAAAAPPAGAEAPPAAPEATTGPHPLVPASDAGFRDPTTAVGDAAGHPDGGHTDATVAAGHGGPDPSPAAPGTSAGQPADSTSLTDEGRPAAAPASTVPPAGDQAVAAGHDGGDSTAAGRSDTGHSGPGTHEAAGSGQGRDPGSPDRQPARDGAGGPDHAVGVDAAQQAPESAGTRAAAAPQLSAAVPDAWHRGGSDGQDAAAVQHQVAADGQPATVPSDPRVGAPPEPAGRAAGRNPGDIVAAPQDSADPVAAPGAVPQDPVGSAHLADTVPGDTVGPGRAGRDGADHGAAGHDGTAARDGAGAALDEAAGQPGGLGWDWAKAEVVRIDDRPALPEVLNDGRKVEYGPLTDENGKPVPMINGDPRPGQVRQRDEGDCGYVVDIRWWLRALQLQKAGLLRLPDGWHLWTVEDAFKPNSDGTWDVTFPEVKLVAPTDTPDDLRGNAVLTGRLSRFTWDGKAPVFIPDADHPAAGGSAAFLDVRSHDAAFAVGVTEHLAREDQAWNQNRAEIQRKEFPGAPDARGHVRLNMGSWKPEQAEVMATLFGHDAVTIQATTNEQAAAQWKALIDDGRPVEIGSISGAQGNPYGVVSGPHAAHAYGVWGVFHGTQAEARAEAERIRASMPAPMPPPHSDPADPGTVVKVKDPTIPTTSAAPSGTPSAPPVPDYVPAPAPPSPADPRWPPIDPNERQWWVIADNPWGFRHPDPVPVAHLDTVFGYSAVTLGTTEEAARLPTALPDPPSPAGTDTRPPSNTPHPARDIPPASSITPGPAASTVPGPGEAQAPAPDGERSRWTVR